LRKESIKLNRIFSFNQQRQLVIGRHRPLVPGRCIQETYEVSSHIRTLMMGTEMVPETSVSSYNKLTRLNSREDCIKFSRRENIKSYNALNIGKTFHQLRSVCSSNLTKYHSDTTIEMSHQIIVLVLPEFSYLVNVRS
jgi:hypothetical protein